MFPFLRQQAENEFCNKVLIERMFCKKSLDSLQTRIGFRWRVESSGQKAKAHRFDCAKSHDKKRNELDVGKIDVFFKEDTRRIG